MRAWIVIRQGRGMTKNIAGSSGTFVLAMLLVMPALLGCQIAGRTDTVVGRQLASIIPQPASWAPGQGHFTVSDGTAVRCAASNADCNWVAGYLTDLVKR